jgi:hypothetical protein
LLTIKHSIDATSQGPDGRRWVKQRTVTSGECP